MVIDDFEPWRRSIRSMLPERQYQLVGEALDGLEGVQKAEELQPHLILLDRWPSDSKWNRSRQSNSRYLAHGQNSFRDRTTVARHCSGSLRTVAHGFVTKSYAEVEVLSAI